jgi:hypothetical protein
MRKFLQKIAWKTHRWYVKMELFNFYLGYDGGKYGVQLFTIKNGISWCGSLFELTWHFPTVTHRGDLRIDLLFAFEKWNDWCIDMIDRKLWGTKLSKWEKMNFWLNKKIRSVG